MLRSSAASSALGKFLLAGILCLLAVAFALEAKSAWYGPAAGLKSEISAAKAWPADMPRLVAQRLSAPAPVIPHIFFLIPAVLIAALLLGADFSRRLRVAPLAFALVRRCFFSPFLFYRPPPVLV